VSAVVGRLPISTLSSYLNAKSVRAGWIVIE
jgi:hypothetical protein